MLQKEHILSFLGAHRFPLGVVACADSLSPTDSQTFKTMYLARLIKEVGGACVCVCVCVELVCVCVCVGVWVGGACVCVCVCGVYVGPV